MAYIKFRNSKDFVKCLIEPKGNIVSLAFPLGEAISTNTSGFDTYLDDKGELLIGEYGAYTTVYRNCPEKTAMNCRTMEVCTRSRRRLFLSGRKQAEV